MQTTTCLCQYALPSSLVQPDGSHFQLFIAFRVSISCQKFFSRWRKDSPLIKRNFLMCFYFDWFSFYYTPAPPFTTVLGRKLDCRRKRKVKKLRMTNISRHTNLIKKEHLEMNNKEESSVVLGELSEFNKKGKQFCESVWIHRSAMISMAFIIFWCHIAALLYDVCALSVSNEKLFSPRPDSIVGVTPVDAETGRRQT